MKRYNRTRQHCNVRALREKMHDKRQREGHQIDFRHIELALAKCVGDEPMCPSLFGRQQPRQFGQIGKVDPAARGPNSVFARHNDQMIMEKNFNIQIVLQEVVELHWLATQDQIAFSIP